jgi:hypothetical protein
MLQVAEDSPLQAKLQDAVVQIYGWLQNRLEQEVREDNPVQTILAGAACIWIGSGFLPATLCVLEAPMDMTPALYVLPATLSPYKDVLMHLGVRRTLLSKDWTRYS